MRFLVYNPNSDARLTGRLRPCVTPRLQIGDSAIFVTAAGGPAFIGSPDAVAAARQSLIEDLPSRTQDCDAVLLACFGDLGIEPLRNRIKIPVVSLWDACRATIPLTGQRTAILTTSAFWVEQLTADIRRQGLSDTLVRVEAIHAAAIHQAMTPRRCIDALIALAAGGDFDRAVLGGALFMSLQAAVTKTSPLPLFDPLALAVGLCRTLGGSGT